MNSLRPTDRPIRIMERSVYSGYACFLATSRERGEITDAEYALAEKWFQLMDSQVRWTLKILYSHDSNLSLALSFSQKIQLELSKISTSLPGRGDDQARPDRLRPLQRHRAAAAAHQEEGAI